ncbi:hypothetical protein AAG596_12340 [Citromicrobium bathyomarinum]|uniref:hypothetical protein n=1 Tax=Citromicrobium bathyomarinum TaxID=72174 RepID=UPI003159E5F0
MRPAALAAALALASIPVAAYADSPEGGEMAEWRAVDAETGKIADIEGVEQLARDFPDSGSVRLRLLNAQLGAGQLDAALETLAWLKARGHVFSAAAQAQIPQLVGESHAEAARALLLPEAEPVEASEVIAAVPAEAGLIESVFAAPAGDTLIATSVTRQALWIREAGDWRRVDLALADDLSGILQDETHNIGWIASSNIDGSEQGETRFSGLIGLGPLDARLYAAAPEGVRVSDLAMGPDGTVYASDPLGAGVYTKGVWAEDLTVLVQPGTFRSPQGLAVSEDGARLYLSDYRYGLAMIDLATGRVAPLESDVPVLLDGIDGLWRSGSELIAMQNGVSPMRIVAFTLSAAGKRIVAALVLEQAHPDWTEPLGGSIADNALVYVATGQWDRYDKGQPVEGKPPLPTQIRRLPLD